jgi:hypothetical protein
MFDVQKIANNFVETRKRARASQVNEKIEVNFVEKQMRETALVPYAFAKVEGKLLCPYSGQCYQFMDIIS